MSLATGDLFARIVAPFFATDFGGLDRLTVDYRRRGRPLLSCGHPHPLPQCVVDLLPQALSSPSPKNSVNGLPIGKVVRQRPPLAARAIDVEDGIDDPAAIHWWTTSLLLRRQQSPDNLPLLVCDITGIICPVHGYGSVFLDRIYQKAEP